MTIADVSSRYIRAQELLSTVRAQVLLSLMRVREGLLNPDPDAVIEYRNQNEASYKIMSHGARRLRAGDGL